MLLSYHIPHLPLPSCGAHSAYEAYPTCSWIDKATASLSNRNQTSCQEKARTHLHFKLTCTLSKIIKRTEKQMKLHLKLITKCS